MPLVDECQMIHVRNKVFTAKPQRTRRSHFCYLAVRGRQITSPLSFQNMHLSETRCDETQLWINPRGREFMIRSPSPACVVGATWAWRRPDRITRCARATARRVRTFPQRSLRLGGEPGFSQSTFEFKKLMKPIGPHWPVAYLGQQ
jgi:hypothetical protein